MTRASTSEPLHAATDGQAPRLRPRSLIGHLWALLRWQPLFHALVSLALAVGFVHGWLKLRFPHPGTTFAFDALLILALALVTLRLPRGTRLFPPGLLSRALLAFYALGAVYLLVPLGPPWFIKVAALRGWCFASLMFLLGYHLISRRSQCHAYFVLLIALALGTVFYALGQNAQDVEQRMKDDAVFAARYFNVHYTTSRGSQLRRFSTFVSSGAFGGTLATVGIVLVALATDPRTRNGERTLLAVACGFLVYGIILSGARTAMGCFVIGVALVLWFRRAVSQAIVWSVALAVVVKLAVDATYGNAAERFTTLFRLDEIVQRNIIPAWIGWNYMVDHPLGGGLGRSSHGVPFFLMTRMDREGFVQADGDLGRLMIELGIPGLVLFGWVMGVGLKTAFASVAATRNTPLLTAALANAACFLAAAMVIPTGSPFLGIPTGMLVWFLQGAMLRLRESDGSGLVTESAGSAAPEPGKPAKRFLYYRPPRPRPPSRRP